jgi:hypothetical protein
MDEDDPKGRNGYNAQVEGRDCTNVNQKGKTGKGDDGGKKTSDEVDKPFDKGKVAVDGVAWISSLDQQATRQRLSLKK